MYQGPYKNLFPVYGAPDAAHEDAVAAQRWGGIDREGMATTEAMARVHQESQLIEQRIRRRLRRKTKQDAIFGDGSKRRRLRS